MLVMKIIMTNDFSHHEPCPNCGSRDNVGRYSDGHGFCFGCGYTEPAVSRVIPQIVADVTRKNKVKPLPQDTQNKLNVKAWQWLRKYDIINSETANYRWSDLEEQLIYCVFGESQYDLLFWQARNFMPKRRKYFSSGPAKEILHIIGESKNSTIILCEDVVSAIKIGRQQAAMPLWGSNIPLETLRRLSDQFNRVGIWLDMNKAFESLKSSCRGSQLNLEMFSIVTPKDPKEYTDEEISKIITL